MMSSEDATKRLMSKKQTLDDAYAAPANFLEIDVINPITHGVGAKRYTDYEVRMKTNLPVFRVKESSVRRRYSDFEWLRNELGRDSKIVVSPLPSKAIKRQLPFRSDDGIYEEGFIEERRSGLEAFVNKIAGHPLAQNKRCLQMFLQEPNIDRNYVPGMSVEVNEEVQKEADVLKLEANEFFKQENFQKAIEHYTKAIVLNPTNAVYYANRSSANFKLQKFESALTDASKAIECDKSYVKAYHRRAAANKKLGNFESALKDYERVHKSLPNDKEINEDVNECRQILQQISLQDLPAANDDGYTTFIQSIFRNNLVDVKQKIEEAKSRGILDVLIKKGDNAGNTPLWWASEKGHVDIVDILLHCHADVNCACQDGSTALFIASSRNHMLIVTKLLAKGADVNLACNNGYNPLIIASQKGHREMVTKLLEKGADVNLATNDGATPLFVASHMNHMLIVAKLLEKGANVNLAMNGGLTPLFVATKNNNTDIVKRLVSWNANVDQEEEYGFTPLMIASEKGHYDITAALLQNGADVFKKDKQNRNSAYLAAEGGHLDVMKLLISQQPTIVSTKGFKNLSMLHTASGQNHHACIKELMKSPEIRKIINDKANDLRDTPLTLAIAAYGDIETVKLLISSGADPNLSGDKGGTPLQYAEAVQKLDISAYLKEEQSNDDLRNACLMTTALNVSSGTLQFNPGEFYRLPNDAENMALVTPEILQQVADALNQSLTSGYISRVVLQYGGSTGFIAAQFKNAEMKGSLLEPRVIEAALTKIFDNVLDFPNLTEVNCSLSYSHNSPTASRGVRCFTIEGKK